MVAADNLVHLGARHQMLGRYYRLIFDEGNGVLMVLALNGETRRHHREGNVAAHVQPHVVATAEMGHAPYRFKAASIQQDERADRGAAREQRFQQLVAQHDYIPPLFQIQLIQPAAFL